MGTIGSEEREERRLAAVGATGVTWQGAGRIVADALAKKGAKKGVGIELDPKKAEEAKDNIKKVEVIDFADLGMEAVWRIEVEDFPAFVVVDDKGNDFFDLVSKPGGTPVTLK